VPVLNWAPGKWFFRRGEIVRELLGTFSSDQLRVGDTTLRPTVWGEPPLMRWAAGNGFAVLAGSDPLPFPGEEAYLGTYASVFECLFDADRPVTSVRECLLSPSVRVQRCGKRCGPLSVLARLVKNAVSKSRCCD
jgi:hypothetical protein